MKPTLRTTVAAVIAAASLGVMAGMWWVKNSAEPASTPALASATAERKPLYWYDPMAPAQHFDKPGKSPYMDMELVPRYPDDADTGSAGIRIDPRLAQNLGIRLATVRQQTLSSSIDAPGVVEFNGRNVAVVQARAGGFVSRVYPHAPGDLVGQGAALVDLLIPEWAAAQQEFLALLNSNEPSLVSAARQRLILTGMSAALISQVESSGRTHPQITLSSPIAGVLDTLEIRAGMTVSAGTTLATVKSIDPIWIEAAVPEAVATGNLVGTDAAIQSASIPGQTFKGRIVNLLPQANADTHTLRVRIEMPNHAGLWRPGMFAQVKLSGPSPRLALVVPSEAVIHTGTRDLVIVAHSASQFEPTEVRIGAQVGDSTAIVEGLQEGQQVVASGQFLIDSEASLRGVETRMRPAAEQSHAAHSPEATP